MNHEVLRKLIELSNEPPLKGYQIGLAGSFVRGEETESSDIDIVVNTDRLSLEQLNFIHNYFDREVDVIQLKLLKEEDKQLEEFAIREGFTGFEASTYENICKEVLWID